MTSSRRPGTVYRPGAVEDVVLHLNGRGTAEDVDDELVVNIPDGAITGRISVVVARLRSYGNVLAEFKVAAVMPVREVAELGREASFGASVDRGETDACTGDDVVEAALLATMPSVLETLSQPPNKEVLNAVAELKNVVYSGCSLVIGFTRLEPL